jgi:TfoX/Sxy family transcriptional regulator of competence genes
VAYDETLASRVRAILCDREDVREQKMFGGLTFMVAGHMCCGVVDDTLMIRLDEELADEAFKKPHVRPMDFTGRPMKAMLYIDPPGLKGRALRTWVERAATYATMRPTKPGR